MKYSEGGFINGFELRKDKKVVLEAKSDFGKSFLEENGTEYIVVTTERWGDYRLLLKSLKKDAETGLVWIGVLPESRNFKIIEVSD